MGRLITKSVLAGIMISIGGTVYLNCTNKFIGSLLFGIGLFAILSYGLDLYTGKVGYLLNYKNKLRYVIQLIFIAIENLVGCWVYTAFMKILGLDLKFDLTNIYASKINQDILTTLFLSILCGMLMYIAVDNYKNNKHELGKYIGLFICVSVFIMCGFEHSIANMFFVLMANNNRLFMSTKELLFILVCVIGNGIGSMLVAYVNRRKKEMLINENC